MYGLQIQRWKLSFTLFDSYTSSKIQGRGYFAAMGGELDAFWYHSSTILSLEEKGPLKAITKNTHTQNKLKKFIHSINV